MHSKQMQMGKSLTPHVHLVAFNIHIQDMSDVYAIFACMIIGALRWKWLLITIRCSCSILFCFSFLHVLEKAWAVAVENSKRGLTKSLSQTR